MCNRYTRNMFGQLEQHVLNQHGHRFSINSKSTYNAYVFNYIIQFTQKRSSKSYQTEILDANMNSTMLTLIIAITIVINMIIHQV